jgi:hypothetical protein
MHGDTKGRVWINATQYFEGVPPAVWEFHVGGWPIALGKMGQRITKRAGQ